MKLPRGVHGEFVVYAAVGGLVQASTMPLPPITLEIYGLTGRHLGHCEMQSGPEVIGDQLWAPTPAIVR